MLHKFIYKVTTEQTFEKALTQEQLCHPTIVSQSHYRTDFGERQTKQVEKTNKKRTFFCHYRTDFLRSCAVHLPREKEKKKKEEKNHFRTDF
jgi:hypothetical protein